MVCVIFRHFLLETFDDFGPYRFWQRGAVLFEEKDFSGPGVEEIHRRDHQAISDVFFFEESRGQAREEMAQDVGHACPQQVEGETHIFFEQEMVYLPVVGKLLLEVVVGFEGLLQLQELIRVVGLVDLLVNSLLELRCLVGCLFNQMLGVC